ncbi:MAG TPA: ABC transporter permease [Anaerolineae bacterium]|nr:ABC transporter permease [Anaerolineae bacterium]
MNILKRQPAGSVATSSGLSPVPAVHIEATQGLASLRLRELWEYRELLYFLTWRDIKVRYKQTVLGASWAIIQPVLTMVVFSLFFGKLAKMPSDGIPYPIFSYAALVPWTFFASGVNTASTSLVGGGARMIKKIYFPRLTMPVAAILGGLVDFCLAFVVLLGMMLFYGFMPTVNTLWLPLFLLLAIITCMGVSFWLSAMNVQFRDVRYAIPFIIQVWLFLTPVAYPSGLIENPLLQLAYALNPMVGVVEGFRWALLGTDPPGLMLIVSATTAIIFFISGMFYFRHMEKSFADVV